MKRIISMVMILAMLFALTACQGGAADPPAGSNAAKPEADAGESAAAASNTDKSADKADSTDSENTSNTDNSEIKEGDFPVSISDQAGRSLIIERAPETIVSSYYISTSILIALGLEDKLVAIEAKAEKRPIYSLAAPRLIELPNIGSPKEFDLEVCAALKPDLVILPLRSKDAAQSLEELGLNVVLINPENTQELYEAISNIAALTGRASKGEELIATIEKMYADLSDLTEDSPAPLVYMAGNSALLSTAGSRMYQSAMIERAGGTNAAEQIDDSYWSAISYEQLLDWNPEYIIMAADAEYSIDDVLSDASLSECSAVKNGNVYKMPNDIEAWDSPVPGGVLGSIWLAGIIHEDKVSKDYYERSVSDFYSSFYGLEK